MMEPPFSFLVQDGAPLTIVMVVQGHAWVVQDGEAPQPLDQGEVAIIRGPAPFTIADEPTTEPQLIIHPGHLSATPNGEPIATTMELGVRTWGNSPTGSTIMLTGTYATDGEINHRLLHALPQLIILSQNELELPIAGLLADQIVRGEPGQDAVLDRLLDLLLIAALRAWFSSADPDVPSWCHLHGDPVIGRALRMLHNDPAHTWTVATLAAAVGMSRAALAKRFNALVGEPPMTHLTRLRLALAADLLRDPSVSVGAAARQVGYSSPFTFSTAFKRHYGSSPMKHRARLDASTDDTSRPVASAG